VPPVSSWPSTSTGPPSLAGLGYEGSTFDPQVEQVLSYLSSATSMQKGTPTTPVPLLRTRILSQAKPSVASGIPTTKTALPRTRLSSLAKPFVPGGNETASSAHGWGQCENNGTSAATYSERVQEVLYLHVAIAESVNSAVYDESLQEEVYLKARVPSRTPSPVRLHWASPPVNPEARGLPTGQSQSCCFATHGLAKSSAVTGAVGRQQEQEAHQKGQQQQDGSLPVRRTCIHYENLQEASTTDRAARKRSASAPSVLVTRWLQLSEKAGAHLRGQCRPCAYFFYKDDGCRQAADCKFCHICPHGEIKQRKKEKREHKRLFKAQALETLIADENIDPLPASTRARG